MKSLLKKKVELKELYENSIKQLEFVKKEIIALGGAIKAVEELIIEEEDKEDKDDGQLKS